MPKARGSRVWLGMLLSGLALGAYVFAAWPDTKTPTETPRVVRTMASIGAANAGPELYPLELFFYEVSPAPLLDALISAPPAADAN